MMTPCGILRQIINLTHSEEPACIQTTVPQKEDKSCPIKISTLVRQEAVDESDEESTVRENNSMVSVTDQGSNHNQSESISSLTAAGRESHMQCVTCVGC